MFRELCPFCTGVPGKSVWPAEHAQCTRFHWLLPIATHYSYSQLSEEWFDEKCHRSGICNSEWFLPGEGGSCHFANTTSKWISFPDTQQTTEIAKKKNKKNRIPPSHYEIYTSPYIQEGNDISCAFFFFFLWSLILKCPLLELLIWLWPF